MRKANFQANVSANSRPVCFPPSPAPTEEHDSVEVGEDAAAVEVVVVGCGMLVAAAVRKFPKLPRLTSSLLEEKEARGGGFSRLHTHEQGG